MDPARSAAMFYNHLSSMNYNDPNSSPGSFAQRVQQSAFPDRYDQRFADSVTLYNRLTARMAVAASVDPNRPKFNEYARWCDNNQDRAGTKVDLWLIHTQEGDGDADSLASFLISTESGPNPVSYHYTISTGYPNDDGVTVCDVVDTDLASWSVENSNNRSINLCFAGSRASWTRDDWITKAARAIDVAAYLCVQDCVKYGIPMNVIAPPYNSIHRGSQITATAVRTSKTATTTPTSVTDSPGTSSVERSGSTPPHSNHRARPRRPHPRRTHHRHRPTSSEGSSNRSAAGGRCSETTLWLKP
jgi:hypothetical protein